MNRMPDSILRIYDADISEVRSHLWQEAEQGEVDSSNRLIFTGKIPIEEH